MLGHGTGPTEREQAEPQLRGHHFRNWDLLVSITKGLADSLQVGNEFSAVEALWSHFESVMDKDAEVDVGGQDEDGNRKEGDTPATSQRGR